MIENLRTYKITDSSFFNALDVDCSQVVAEDGTLKNKEAYKGAINQFLIFDRSGSMYGYIDDVIDNAMAYCNSLPEGSKVSVGYFSGMGEYNVSIPYELEKEINGVTKTLNTFRDTCSVTNFIEVLQKVSSTVSASKEKASLFFFTDGCHNTGGSFQKVLEQLHQWKPYAEISMFVGYGYIDRDNMQEMAQACDGSFIHLNKFSDFNEVLKDFGLAVEDLTPSVEVDLSFVDNIDNLTPVSIAGKNIIAYSIDEDKKIKFRPSKKGYKGIFFLTDKEYSTILSNKSLTVTDERGARALAFSLSQSNKVNASSLILNDFLEEKYLFRILNSSISPDEYAKAEDQIKKSIFNTKDRYKEGKTKHVIDPNAFCVLDAINVLLKEEKAKVYTFDPEFNYERISRKSERADGPSIEYDKAQGSFINDIVMNKERLNISLNTYATGWVSTNPSHYTKNPFTKETLAALKLPEKVEVTSFKNYSIIADGRLKIEKLILSDLSKEAINTFSSYLTLRDDKKYVLSLTDMPLVNSTYTKSDSVEELCKMVWDDKIYSDVLSTANFLYKELTGETAAQKTSNIFDPEQEKFLKEHCYIKGTSYQPPMSTTEPVDMYMAYNFKIDIKGFSKANAKDVIKKVRDGKEPTQRESIIGEAYNTLSEVLATKKEKEDQVAFLSTVISDTKEKQKEVRTFISGSKFAIALINKGQMKGVEGRGEQTFSIELATQKGTKFPIDFYINIEKVEVKI